MKTDEWLIIILAIAVVLLVFKGISVRHEGESFAQSLYDKFQEGVNFLKGVQPVVTNNYNQESKLIETATPTQIKLPSCLVYSGNRDYCLEDCFAPGVYQEGARYCIA